MSRRALLVFLPFALSAMLIVGIATAGTGDPEITITPSQQDGWYQAPITLSWTVTGDPEFQSGCEDVAIGESAVTPYTCTAQHSTGQPTSVTVNIGVDLTAPTFPDPPDIGPLQATSPAGAQVTYSASATDNLSNPTVVCNPPSGSVFPIGPNQPVSCTATDAAGNSTSASFNVTIIPPNTPPALSVPGSITQEATGPSGAKVNYSATASDAEDDPDPPANCNPASGSTFPLGSTTVNCTATDSGGLSADPKSFSVEVQDTTPPSLTVPASITVQTSGTSANVSYPAATAVDLVDPSPTVGCSPESGVFTIGQHTVTCTASDGSGNSTSDSFTITVQDGSAPIVVAPGNITVEANGPSGAIVSYPPATASDTGSPSLQATCTPPSRSTFPLGRTQVTCVASDAQGNVGSASFFVTVTDTTPPVLTAPADLAVQSTGPVAATDSRIKAFLGGATATDIVDTSPAVTTNAPSSFPVGVTTVTFTARDDAGNTTQKDAKLTVSPDPPGQPGGDTTPPENVGSVRAILGNLAVSLSWKPPANDFDHVDVVQSPAPGGGEKVVYSGKKKSFVAKGLTNGVEYRFVVVAYDKAGNRASGVAVVALAQQQTLLAPPNGAVLSAAPLVKWKPAKGAKYYNAQIWFEPTGSGRAVLASAAARKVMSVWPTKASFKMKKSWRFGGKKFTLKQGRYLLYIWPGVGPKSANRYGKLLVQAEFTISRG